MDRESEVRGDGGACMERWGKGHMHVNKILPHHRS